MLTLDEGIFLVRTARATFFQHLGDRSTSNSRKSPPARLQEKIGAYVRVEVFTERLDPRGLTLGFTGYPMPHKSAYQSVRDASIAIASRSPRPPPHRSKTSFEVTLLSPPQSLKTMRLPDVISAIEFGRDAVMITSGLTKAIILPQTAITKCQDTVALLAECCTAAGLMADAWVTSPEVDLLRFPTQIFREKRDGKSVIEISLQEGLRRAQVNQS